MKLLKNKAILSQVLVTLGVMIVCAIVVYSFATVSMAWFVKNEKATATGMLVTKANLESMIISDDPDEVTNITQTDPNQFSFVFTRSDIAVLNPVTHDDDFTTYPTGLKYVTNTDSISAASGLAKAGATYNYAAAPNNNSFFIDYTVYIGTAERNSDYTNLTIWVDYDNTFVKCLSGTKAASGIKYYSRTGSTFSEVTSITVGTTDVSNYYVKQLYSEYKAVTMDVYFEDTYRGMMRPTLANQSLLLSASGTVTQSDPLKITIRCYFDGAYLDSSTGKAYVRAGNQIISNVFLAVKYTAN